MKRLALALVLIASPALAQPQPQPQPQRVTAAQMLSTQIGTLAVQNAMNTELIATLQEQLDAAKARIKELEAAAKPPTEPPKP